MVIRDIEEYLGKIKVTWIDPDEDEEIRAIPGWDKTPDFSQEIKKQAAKRREKNRRLKPTVKVIRPKRSKAEKDQEKPSRKKGGYLGGKLTTHQDIVKLLMKILDDKMDGFKDEDDEEEND